MTDDFREFDVSETEHDPRDEALARLEAALSNEADRRKEERFIWLCLTVVLVDILLLRDSGNPTLPIIVLVLELIVLVILARRMGIEDVALILDRVLHTFSRRPPD